MKWKGWSPSSFCSGPKGTMGKRMLAMECSTKQELEHLPTNIPDPLTLYIKRTWSHLIPTTEYLPLKIFGAPNFALVPQIFSNLSRDHTRVHPQEGLREERQVLQWGSLWLGASVSPSEQ